jgi:hypothetical protein
MDSTDDSADGSDPLKSEESIILQDFCKPMDVLYRLSSVPHIACFAEAVAFAALYSNSIAHQKVLITNASITTEYVQLSIDGDAAFELRTAELAIASNSTESAIVSFRPLADRQYSGILRVQGNAPAAVNLTGKCLQPPIDITNQEDPCWSVPVAESQTWHFSVVNRSLQHRFTVKFATNSAAFSVTDPEVELDPASRRDVEVNFNAALEISASPKLTAICEASSQVIKRKFFLTKPTPLTKVDFGAVAIGNSTKKSLLLPSPISVEPPFSAVVSRQTGKSHITFAPSSPGNYQSLVHFDEFDLELIGEAVPLPFKIEAESQRIENLIDEEICLSFHIDPATVAIDPEQLSIPPLSTAFYVVAGESRSGAILTVTWNDVVAKFELPPIIPDPPESQSPQIRIAAHPSFLSFFQLESDCPQTRSLIVTGCDDFELEGPKWCRFPAEIEVDSPIGVTVRSLSRATMASAIKIDCERSAPLIVPVIAYRGKSEITFPDEAVLAFSEDCYVAQIEIRNAGSRVGFAIVTASPESSHYKVKVAPVAAVIRPNSREIFEFLVDILSAGPENPRSCVLR